MKRTVTMLLGVAALTAAAASNPPLKIYKGEQRSDTVYSSTYYLIGVTDPAARATVAGDDCHVYATGSFGKEISLSPGVNTIPVKVTADGRSTSADVTVFYSTGRPAGPAAQQEVLVPLDEPVTVVTRDGAYLQHGTAGDRLGGSKMNFLPEGIAMQAVAVNSRLYKVRLGAEDAAYIPRDAVEQAPDVSLPQWPVATGSISVADADSVDRVTVSLPCRLPYYSRTEIDPSTILITLYGAANNTNWLTQRSTPEMIDYVDLRREGNDRLTLVLRLRDKYQWGYSVGYDGNSLVIDVRHRPASLDIRDLVIGLDAGHGGEYLGAVSPSGITEKEANLDIVLKAATLLRDMGARVVLTRDGDTGPSMSERKAIWLAGDVDIAISVHNNSSGNPLRPMGTSAYYKHISNRALADALHRSVLADDLADFGLTGNFNFSLNQPTEYPNALVEVLFMSSLPEEEMLASETWRAELARRIVDGLLDYLEQVKASLR